MKKIVSIFIIVFAIILTACSNEKEKETMSLEDATVKMARIIDDDKLMYLNEQKDIHTFKDNVKKLRPYVDAFKNSKPKNKSEKQLTTQSTLFKSKDFISLLDNFVKTAEDESAIATVKYFSMKV